MNQDKYADLGQATLESYMTTRRQLLAKADELSRTISQLEPVRNLETMHEVLRLERDRRNVIGMISNCSYAIDWLETGRRPGNRRGMERRARYQREVPIDPFRLACRLSLSDESVPVEEQSKLSRRLRIEEALRGLTDRERDCYGLAHGEGYSYAEIAVLLDISKSSVSTYMLRAQRKVAFNVSGRTVHVG